MLRVTVQASNGARNARRTITRLTAGECGKKPQQFGLRVNEVRAAVAGDPHGSWLWLE